MGFSLLSRLSPHTRKLFRNAAILFSGNVISAIFSILTIAVLTRALTLEDFGRYALITAFINLVDRLVNFQSWQALIHFGSSAIEAGDESRLLSLFSFGVLLDVVTGIAGYVILLILGYLNPVWIGLGDNSFQYVAIAGCLVLFNWTATPTAVLRLYDKFYKQAVYTKVTSGAMFIFSLMLWLSGVEDILFYVVALTISGLTGKALFYWMAFSEAQRQGVLTSAKIDFANLFITTPKLWRFVITTNMDGVVRVFRDIDMFIINAILGPTSVALYKVARTLTKAFGQLTGPFYQSIYPDLSRLRASGNRDDFIKLMKQSSISLGAITLLAWVTFAVLGDFFLQVGFGENYLQAYGVSLLCMAAMVIWSISLPLSPAMMAIGKVEITLLIHVLSTAIYIGMLVVFTSFLGLIGSGLSFLIFYALWSLSMLFAFKRQYKY